ncbi:putative RDD family membrane protein YckC [Streptomyces sp. V3I8]|uniref:RDD family protein n=1 Tax=Streptomyces sp. V3I8 TaxID=3042279 RepID=UPI002784BE81|nr:RDD family protein [Streptomyces sp. V3I8]MDQ1038354.1 putative RDD family membrane protein YckC [Streptomyces sp. V3I8]
MSAPTPAPGDDRPREGYYPDPSIPGYVRYWNGASWVPGTSRPAPAGGESISPSPSASAPAAARPAPVSTEETGPHFFDEDPPSAAAGPSPAEAQHGSRPEPATAWGADRSRQTGFGGDPDRRVRWGSPDPRVPSDPAGQSPPAQQAQPVQQSLPAQQAQPDGRSDHTDGTATFHASDAGQDGGTSTPPSSGTVVFRRPTGPVRPTDAAGATGSAGSAGAMGAGRAHVAGKSGAGSAPKPGTDAAQAGAGAAAAAAAGNVPGQGAPGSREPASGPLASEPLVSEGTMTFRTVSPRAGQEPAAQARPGSARGPAAPASSFTAPAAPAGPQQVQPAPAPAPTPSPAPAAAVPPQQSAAQAPMSAGPGGGQPSWAQQVHRLAGPDEEQPVVPWKPVREDPFQAAARSQANARPAGLGKRFAARLVDTLVLAVVTGAAAVPLGTRALDHVDGKIDAAKQSGETVTVWLLDGTTALYLGLVLAVLIVFGVLYEALPTAKWGRTPGKKLFGLQVRDIEGGDPPSFGPALRRWLVYIVPGVLVIGVAGVVWGLFDRPWRQCWHDKAAHTFVAG